MLQILVKKIATLFLIGIIFISGFEPSALISFFKGVIKYSEGGFVVDKIYLAKQNKNVVDNFFSGTQKAEAAISKNEREYMVHIGPVNGSTAANYVYASFFNPSGSGRTAVIKRIAVRSNTGTTTAANYVNLTVRRTTAAPSGTQIAVADIPKKNASSSDSIIEVRHTGASVTLAGTVDSRILGQPQSGAVGSRYSYRDITFGDNDEKIVIQPGEGIAVYQEAAGDADSRVRVYIEWDEQTSAPTAQNEFLFAFPRVEVAAAANYVYNSFFNPVSSGKVAVVKRIWFGTETCDTTAVYTNNIVLKRTTAASAGTAITASNVPKKNTSSSNSVMEFRRTGVTVTEVGGADARIGHITPCAAAGQIHGWQEINFHTANEKLILQQGEGIALKTEAVGDIDQIVRMIVEWDEVDIADVPASQGEYIWASPRIESASVANVSRFTFFNPTGSGKVMTIKRLGIRINADTTANYPSFGFRRVSAASAGTLIAATDVPKKHTGTANTAMEIRWCGAACATAITATYVGTADSRLLSVNGAGTLAQTIGQREIVFGNNENIILQEGEGVGFYNDVLTSDVDQYVKVFVEWGEVATAPSALNEYLVDVGPINGSTATSYNYVSFFNPAASGKTAIIKRVSARVDVIAAGGYIPMQLRRTTSASAGTLIAAANIPKKHTGTANTAMEIRRTGVTITYAGTTDSKLLAIQTPGAVGSAIAGETGYKEYIFENDEYIILQPGEGVGFYHDTAAGDADLRVKVLFEWEEVASGSTPASEGEYLMTTGPVNQSTALNYVYSSFFNPVSSAKKYVVKRIGVQANRSGTAVQPFYTTATLRKITSASAGTLVASTSVPRKHSGTATTTAEIRHTGVTATFANATTSRLINVTIPGVVNQTFGQFENNIVFGDEYILLPGEGIALYQESTTGDALVRYRFSFEWSEVDNTEPPQSISFSISTSTLYLGTLSSVQTRYASSTGEDGSDTEVEAHTVQVSTNAASGYFVTVQGATLTSGLNTISAIGGVASAPVIGTEQFGLKVTASGGSGTVVSPYNGTGFAYSATATTSSQIASATSGDDITTTYSIRYMANTSNVTDYGS
ncbi:MAG: hypothetical protein KBB50_04095, partial [Candidatus Pacebacteria bacterium]|nr:hypothetical protein [Candidatus Paceibacterota bacterium]